MSKSPEGIIQSHHDSSWSWLPCICSRVKLCRAKYGKKSAYCSKFYQAVSNKSNSGAQWVSSARVEGELCQSLGCKKHHACACANALACQTEGPGTSQTGRLVLSENEVPLTPLVNHYLPIFSALKRPFGGHTLQTHQNINCWNKPCSRLTMRLSNWILVPKWQLFGTNWSTSLSGYTRAYIHEEWQQHMFMSFHLSFNYFSPSLPLSLHASQVCERDTQSSLHLPLHPPFPHNFQTSIQGGPRIISWFILTPPTIVISAINHFIFNLLISDR